MKAEEVYTLIIAAVSVIAIGLMLTRRGTVTVGALTPATSADSNVVGYNYAADSIWMTADGSAPVNARDRR